MEIKKVGVVGCGLMGAGIAQAAVTAGFPVTVLETEQRLLEKGFANISRSLARLANKGSLGEDPAVVSGRLQGTLSHKDLADCDIIVEAIVENVDAKKKLFATLDSIAKPDAIFATNT